MKAGYAYIFREYGAEDVITVELDMEVKRVYTSSRVAANTGKAALQRGPLVYCAEGYWEVVSDDLYSYDAPVTKECQITLVPYYSWANRGLNESMASHQ